MSSTVSRLLISFALCGSGCTTPPVGEYRLPLAAQYRCEPAASPRTTVAQIRAAPAQYVGLCVTLTARSNGVGLYDSQEELDRYEQAPTRWRDIRMIGVYLPPKVEREITDLHLLWTVSGRVDTCERVYARSPHREAPALPSSPSEPDQFLFVTGYCHQRERGPVVNAHHARAHLQ
jgi:hypothetical protein